jgi:multidrug efflux pump subunit AcrA (membrane-fusion protein)
MKTKTIVFFVIGLGLLLAACGTGGTSATEAVAVPTVQADETVISEGRVEPVRFVEIGFNASGLVSEALVKQGDPVEAGQVIARLESNDAQTFETARASATRELADANETVRAAQNALDDFRIPMDLRPMGPEEAVRYTYEQLEKARADYEPYKYIHQRRDRDDFNQDCKIQNGVETCKNIASYYDRVLRDTWDKYRQAIEWWDHVAMLDDAKAKRLEAQKNYDDLQNGANPEETAGIRASLADAELRAPFPGTVAKLDLKVGETASAGTTIATIADFSKWVIKTTDLTEIDVVNIKQGQTALITLDAVPDVELTGTVDAVGLTYSEKQGDIVYEVTIILNDTNPNLRWGMTAEVKFER